MAKNVSTAPLVPDGDDFLFPVDEFKKVLFDKMFPMEALGIDKSITTFWRREGLLPFIQSHKHAWISPVQGLWVLLLNEVRELGLPKKRMTEMTEYFMHRAYRDSLPKLNIEHNIRLLEDKAKVQPLSVEELELLMQIKRTLEDTDLLDILNWDVNYFSNLVLKSITTGQEAAVLLFKDYIAENTGRSYYTFPDRESNLLEPHVRISLNYLLKHFVNNDELQEFTSLFYFPTEDEKKVLDAIWDKNVKTVTIKRGKGKDPLTISTTQTKVLSREDSAMIRKIMRIGNFETITLDTIDGTTLSVTKTKKKL